MTIASGAVPASLLGWFGTFLTWPNVPISHRSVPVREAQSSLDSATRSALDAAYGVNATLDTDASRRAIPAGNVEASSLCAEVAY
jgi:hypothetical protein